MKFPLFMSIRMHKIVSSINNFHVYMEPNSPLMDLMYTHIVRDNCIDCNRFVEYYQITFQPTYYREGVYSQKLSNGYYLWRKPYSIKPTYPSCHRGILIYKKFFSSMVKSETILSVDQRHGEGVLIKNISDEIESISL